MDDLFLILFFVYFSVFRPSVMSVSRFCNKGTLPSEG